MPVNKPIRGTSLNYSNPLARGLMGCWLFAEGTGQVVSDIIDADNKGLLSGGSHFEPGFFGHGLRFDGTDDFVQCGQSLMRLDENDEVTVIAWMKKEQGGDYYQFLCQRGQYVFPFMLSVIIGDCRIRWGVRTSSDLHYLIGSSGLVSMGQWTQFVGTYRPGQQRIYINGVLRDEYALSGSLALNGTETLTFGGCSGMSNWFAGMIDHVMIYNRCLSEEEIAFLYSRPFAMFREKSPVPRLMPSTFVVKLAGSTGCKSSSMAGLTFQVQTKRPQWFCAGNTIFQGMGANAFKLGTVLSQGWFWVRRSGCSALFAGKTLCEIDYKNILTVAGIDADEISPPLWFEQAAGSDFFYVVGRCNSIGNMICPLGSAIKVSLDEQGELVNPGPNKIVGLHAKQTNVDTICLSWFYSTQGQELPPKLFTIYCSNVDSSKIDYASPAGEVKYYGRRYYEYCIGEKSPGHYTLAVCAQDYQGNRGKPVLVGIKLTDGNLAQIDIQDISVY